MALIGIGNGARGKRVGAGDRVYVLVLDTEVRENHASISARDALAPVAVDTFGYKVVKVASLLRKHPNSLSRWRSKPPNNESNSIQKRILAAIEIANRPDRDSD